MIDLPSCTQNDNNAKSLPVISYNSLKVICFENPRLTMNTSKMCSNFSPLFKPNVSKKLIYRLIQTH